MLLRCFWTCREVSLIEEIESPCLLDVVTVSSPVGSKSLICRWGQPHWCGLHQIWLQWKWNAGWVWTCCHATRHLENCLEEPKKPSQICGFLIEKNPWRFSQTWRKYLASIATLQIGNELKWGTRGVRTATPRGMEISEFCFRGGQQISHLTGKNSGCHPER